MKRKLLFISIGLTMACFSLKAQKISGSLGEGTFVQGISPVLNTITVEAIASTNKTIFQALDASSNVLFEYPDSDGSDGFTWEIDMGELPPDVRISAEFFDDQDNSLGNSDELALVIIEKPQWLVAGSVKNVVINNNIISFEGNYPIYNYPYTIPNTIMGIGGRSIDIAGQLIFNAEFDMDNSTSTIIDNKAQIKLNLLDQLPSYTKDLTFPTTCNLDNSLNLAFVITKEITTEPISLNMPKVQFPVGGLTISIDAGINLYATLKGQLVIGQAQGQWGFIDNGGEKTKVIGILTGEGFIRGDVSALGGVASLDASLQAKARLGIGFDFVSVPMSSFNPLSGGDLNVYGKVCYKTFWGLGPSGCKELPSFYYGHFGDTTILNSNSLKSSFKSESVTFKDTGTLVLPSFNPQPTFATRGESLYATWLEHDKNDGILLFSKLNKTGSSFSENLIVAQNSNSISNPKVGILPSGSAIISWSQSRYDALTLPTNKSDDDMAQAQDVWFAIYDISKDTIVYKNRLGDNFDDNESGRAEGEASISIGDNNDAMIAWVSKDKNLNTSDIWFTHLTESSDSWNLTTPSKLVDLTGTNYNVGIVYTDSVSALAVWINDIDGDIDTYNSNLLFSEWDGNSWSAAQTLLSNDGATKLKEISLSSNNGYTALAWTSTNFENDNDFENRIDMEVYDAVKDDWDTNSHFDDVDSIYTFQKPIVSISDIGLASICYQVINMFPDTNFIDNGELYLYAKDLNGTTNWTEISNNTNLCDTNTYIWELTAGFSGSNQYYTMTQEYNNDGIVTNPYKGIMFGDPNLSMVLRGIKLNSDLSIDNITLPIDVPTGIKELKNNTNFRLLNIYPNPFTDITTFEFQLEKLSKVQLELYNIVGSKVSELINAELSTGIYKTIFKAGDLPVGIYFSKLTVDGISTTAKIVLTK